MEPDAASTALKEDIRKFHRRYLWHRRGSFLFSTLLVISGLALSAGAVVAGIADEGKLAAALAAGTGVAIAAQNALAPAKKNEFYRVICAETENLLDALDFKPGETEHVVDLFLSLRRRAAERLPQGGGMEAIRGLAETGGRDRT